MTPTPPSPTSAAPPSTAPAADDRDRAAAEHGRLRQLVDALPVLLAYVDADQRYRFLSRTYAEWFGIPVEAALGRRIPEMMPPDIYAVRAPMLERALAGETLRFMAPVRIGEGLAPTETLYVPDRGADGRVRGLFLLIQEVAERENALAELREAEARFRLIADSAPVPMWVTAPDGRREFVNASYCRLIGLSYAQALAQDWRELLHADDYERIGALQAYAVPRAEPVSFEARFRRVDGAWIWLRADSSPRFDALGRHVGFIGVAHDITAAKAAEARAADEVQARTRERDRLWALSRDPFVISDPVGRWVAANPACSAILGWSEAELLAAAPGELIHPDDRGALMAHSRALAAGAPPSAQPSEARLRAKSGEWRVWTWSAVLEDGALYCSARDVTEERLRQAELQAAQDALQQSQKMEALGQLTGGIAHDFNNLLTPVTGGLDLLRRRTPPEDARTLRLLDTALQASSRAATLVQRLLAFARRQDLRPRTVDVGALVEGVEDLIARSLGPEIKVRIKAKSPLPARIDPGQLELALLNLCINSRDAMPGGGEVVLRADRLALKGDAELAPGDYVRITVEDTGAGMDAATLKSAIEPFFSTKGLGRGTGLGLSMVHGLAAQSGGALRLESEPGRGTCATLWLPAVAVDLLEATGGLRLHLPPRPPPAPGTTLLVVDDESLVREATSAMLSDLGYVIVQAGSGPEALERLRGGDRIDGLVTDFVMPGMDGARLAAEARRTAPELPVLLVTGYTNAAPGCESLPRLQKPFRQPELAEAVAAALNAEEMRRQA